MAGTQHEMYLTFFVDQTDCLSMCTKVERIRSYFICSRYVFVKK